MRDTLLPSEQFANKVLGPMGNYGSGYRIGGNKFHHTHVQLIELEIGDFSLIPSGTTRILLD